MNWQSASKWSLAIIGIVAVIGLAAMASFHGLTDFQFKLTVSAVLALSGAGTGIQAVLEYIDKLPIGGPKP